jgi:hypothetical protein
MRDIPLTQGKVATVDDEDFTELSKHRWCAQKNKRTYYAARTPPAVDGKRRLIFMHLVIAKTPGGLVTDHINGNGLDNRKENLRFVTHRENCQNRHTKKSSKYAGVDWKKNAKKWRAQIRVDGKKPKHLGYYDDEETACIVYAMACNALKMGCVL